MAITAQEYSEAAYALRFYPKTHRETYPILKLAGEWGEMLGKWRACQTDQSGTARDELLLECGDVLWYVNAALITFGDQYLFCENLNHVETYTAIEFGTGTVLHLCEIVGKHVRDGDDVERIRLILNKLKTLQFYLVTIINDVGSTEEEVAEMNLAKLTSRKARGVQSGDGDHR